MASTFTLAHISDVHLGPLPRFALRHWGLKRGLGYLNWHRNRRSAHLPATLGRLITDLKAQRPDHIAVTGDLINIGLPAEYEEARQWLSTLGPPGDVTVIPGNHDIYARLGPDPGVGRWHSYMQANTAGLAVHPAPAGTFPFVRRFGNIALIGLNSAVPTRPFEAAGELGAAQRTTLEDLLDRLGRHTLARVVLIHHPPLPGQASRLKALRDASALRDLLRRHGAELVLHGHNHRSELTMLDRDGASVPIVGVPSASLGRPHHDETLARYHLYRITEDGPQFGIDCVARGLKAPDGPVVEIERRHLTPTAIKP